MAALSYLWSLLFSWMPLPLAIIAAVLMVVSVIALVCRVLKFIMDAIPFV